MRAKSPAVAAVSCSLLLLLLPVLTATRSLGEPATPGELVRLERAVAPGPPTQRIDTPVSRWLHTAAIGAATWPESPSERQSLVVRARVAQVVGVAAIALLTWLVVLLGRGRLPALLAVAFVAVLPPVLQAGHVLRPQTPAIGFALLSLLLLQVAATATPSLRRRHPRRRALLSGSLMLWAALAAALAVAALPSHGLPLLLPGMVLVVGAVLYGVRGVRCLRRRGLYGTPVRAINGRMLPWTATALVAPAITLLLLDGMLTVPVDRLAITAPASALLPAAGVSRVVLLVVLCAGTAVSVVRIGLGLVRGGLIGPQLLLFLFAALTLVAYAAGSGEHDPLMLLPGIAVLLAEGSHAALVLTSGLLPRVSAR